MATLAEGARAPVFEGRTSTGGTLSLDDFVGQQPVVLFFYVKDFTPG